MVAALVDLSRVHRQISKNKDVCILKYANVVLGWLKMDFITVKR